MVHDTFPIGEWLREWDNRIFVSRPHDRICRRILSHILPNHGVKVRKGVEFVHTRLIGRGGSEFSLEPLQNREVLRLGELPKGPGGSSAGRFMSSQEHGTDFCERLLDLERCVLG